MIKLENKYIKSKIKAKYGELEVYNPHIFSKVHKELIILIGNNSKEIQLENKQSDVEIGNMNQIMRFLLINCSNIETEEYWNDIDDSRLEEMLNLSNGDFKKVINSFIDIVLEIGQDIRIQNIRKLDILSNKLNELVESIKSNSNVDKALSKLGLDREKLKLLQDGDKETIEKIQQNIVEEMNKPKATRGRPKKKK